MSCDIARRAGVDRTFLYRHRNLLDQVHAQAAEPHTVPAAAGPPSAGPPCKPTCSPPTPAQPALAAHVRRLEARLSKVLGEQVWRESGIGALQDTEQCKARLTTLDQQVVNLELRSQDRDDDLAAAHAANLEADGPDQPPTRRTHGREVKQPLEQRTPWRTLEEGREAKVRCRTNGPAGRSLTGGPSGEHSGC
ncbi:hypothetical protein [Sphaerisporangium album]|uniref:hypothetical protein n=1 Tax=Sphaerisporangium album TaxID=509200 RepID=UPI0011C070EF|nr:hypothetical protein [Sphaerisporangium album]